MKYRRSKGSEELFNKWKHLAQRVQELAYIIQNPMHVSMFDINKWNEEKLATKNALDDLGSETYMFVHSQPLVDDPVAEGYDGR